MAKSDDREPDASSDAGGFSEEEFKAKLLKMGRLRKHDENAPTPEGGFTPVEVRGEPLSESIIKDRR